MILQALKSYYDRANLAPPGWEYKEIPFVIVLDREGNFVRLENKTSDENRRGKPILVPQSEIRSGKNAWQKTNLLWDHYGFILGQAKRKPNGEPDPLDSPEKAGKQLGAFVERINTLASSFPDSIGLAAVQQFYQRGEYDKVISDPVSIELFKIPGANLTFTLVDQVEPVLHEEWVSTYLNNAQAQSDGESAENDSDDEAIIGICLVTGEKGAIARLHPKTKGVCDKPAALSAANTGAFPAVSSYGKEQGYNFPIGKPATFAYTTALNHLLARDSRQRIQVGDASTVFWSEQPNDLETALPDLFGEPPKDDPNRGTDALKVLYQAVDSGKFTQGTANDRFHVLGLAPNAARIAIRFWETASALDLAKRIASHFDDIKIVRAPRDPEHLSLFRLLTALAVQGKADNVPPNLGGEIMRAILEGLPYPASLLNLAVQRCRAEQEPTYARAAAIKAVLNRLIRRANQTASHPEKEFQIMLDPTNTNPAYRLGRLFATLEKIQEEANPGLNATIRDRYYGAASSTPVAVFTTLLRLHNHHLGKLSKGRAVQMERLVGEIMGSLDDFPRILALPDQGRFALGYYHQRQAFFTKSDTTTTDNQEESK
ncbi:MAG: type I-C CRISPR-associated protein Cas8c/Csd1 [Porticoccaceae bacterium]